MVHEVKTKVIPELTDEIVEELNIEEVKTVDQYKEHIKAQIAAAKEAQYENHITETVIKTACDNAKIDLPESMIEQEFERRMHEVEHQAEQYNIPVELFIQYNGFEIEDFKAKLREASRSRIFEQLVLEEIAKVEKIEVNEEDIDAEINKFASENKMEAAQVKKMVDLAALTEHLRMQKTINLLKEKAIIE